MFGHPTLARRPHGHEPGQGGYLLVVLSLVLMLVAGVIGVIASDTQRATRAQAFYTLGEQFADLAAAAHNVAQNQFYISSTAVGGSDLIGAGLLPEFANRFAMTLYGTNFQVQALGVDSAPMDTLTPLTSKAVSAVLYLHPILPSGGEMLAVDTAAFIDGAKAHTMPGIGVVGATFAPGDDFCDGQFTIVRWGSGDTACFNQTQLTTIGIPTPQPGDLIVPAWETALAQLDQRALMRFPQPGHPELSQMASSLDLANNNIIAAADMQPTSPTTPLDLTTNDLTVTGAATLTDAQITAGVVAHATATFTGTTDVQGNMAAWTPGTKVQMTDPTKIVTINTTSLAPMMVNQIVILKPLSGTTIDLSTVGDVNVSNQVVADKIIVNSCNTATGGFCPP